MKVVINIILSIVLSALFISCSKCEERQLPSALLNENDLKLIPYSVGDNIALKDSLNDSILINVKNRLSRILICPQYVTGDNPGYCKGDYYETQENIISLLDLKGNHSSLKLMYTDLFRDGELKKILNIRLKAPVNELEGFYGVFLFEGDSLFNPPVFDGKYNRIISFHDSLQINQKLYRSVYELEGTPYTITPWLKTIYYSSTIGIIMIRSSTGNEWCLKE